MPLLTITNLLAHEVSFQDPTGLYGVSITVPASGSVTNRFILSEALEAMEAQLNAAQTASMITWSSVADTTRSAELPDNALLAQVQVALRYTYAVSEPTIHMEADLEGLTSLTPPGPSDVLATACAFVAALQTPWSNHISGVGSPIANGEHRAADGTNTLAATPATLPNLISWIGKVSGGATGTAAAIIAHATQSGVHFSSDTGTGGTGFTLSVDPPVTQADCNADLTDIWNAMKTHFNRGTAVLPWPD